MKKYSKVLSMVLAVFMVFGMTCISTVEADAASAPVKIMKHTYWVGEESWGPAPYMASEKVCANAMLLSVKSSNKKVLKVVKTEGDDLYSYYLVPKKAGKSKITLKYKYKGKTYKLSKTMQVKKYPKPIKKIKINGKTKKPSKYKFSCDTNNYKKTSAKIKITPAKGWKITGGYISQDESYFKTLKASVFKNGKSIKLKKDCSAYIYITMVNKKGETFDYGVSFIRENE